MPEHLFLTCYHDGNEERLGLQTGDILYALGEPVSSLDHLLTHTRASELVTLLASAKGKPVSSQRPPRLSFNGQEVWAAGVTYKRSEEARERESSNSNIYTRVYEAQRPELFLKAMGYSAVSAGDPVGIRYDASWSVPEPELAIVLNAQLEVIGFTLANDMSSRDIEGENPLYLPQAKVYESACALGPRLWLQPNIAQWPDVTIRLEIKRGGSAVFAGETSTASLHRTLPDLVSYLGRCKRFRHGAVLLSGTGIVPPDSFTLQAGDEVIISADPIGVLANSVTVVGQQHEA